MGTAGKIYLSERGKGGAWVFFAMTKKAVLFTSAQNYWKGRRNGTLLRSSAGVPVRIAQYYSKVFPPMKKATRARLPSTKSLLSRALSVNSHSFPAAAS